MPSSKILTITFSTETGFLLDTTVTPATHMLRPHQNRDLMRHLLKAGSHQCPDTGAMTLEKLEHMVDEQQRKKSEAAAAAAANQPAPLAVSEAQDDAASEIDGMVVDLVPPAVAAMALAGERTALTSGVAAKNSGKANGRGRKAKPQERQACHLGLEGPTRSKPRHASVFGTHSDTQFPHSTV